MRDQTDRHPDRRDEGRRCGTPQHGLCSNRMALITSDFDKTRPPPEHQMALITSDCATSRRGCRPAASVLAARAQARPAGPPSKVFSYSAAVEVLHSSALQSFVRSCLPATPAQPTTGPGGATPRCGSCTCTVRRVATSRLKPVGGYSSPPGGWAAAAGEQGFRWAAGERPAAAGVGGAGGGRADREVPAVAR